MPSTGIGAAGRACSGGVLLKIHAWAVRHEAFLLFSETPSTPHGHLSVPLTPHKAQARAETRPGTLSWLCLTSPVSNRVICFEYPKSLFYPCFTVRFDRMVLLESWSLHLSQLISDFGDRYRVKFCTGPLAIVLLDAETEIMLCT